MTIEQYIFHEHNFDTQQLYTIFSSYPRIIVEAPAGCGKTKILTNKIVYLLNKNKIPINKKILGLTFSTNTAYKMKRDISDQLSKLNLSKNYSPNKLNKKIFITNYHGLCRKILYKYGYLLHPNLKNINKILPCNEDSLFTSDALSDTDVKILKEFSSSVKNCNQNFIDEHLNEYADLVINKLLPNNIITYNSYLVLSYTLLLKYSSLKNFYQILYPYIMIDEFQDTNYICWMFLNLFINSETKLFFMGDSLQRIYGFIGAIPNILEISTNKFNMHQILLKQNYRFRHNSTLLLLNENIRANAYNFNSPNIEKNASIKLKVLHTQEEEANYIFSKINKLTGNIAILISQRNNNINVIIDTLRKNNIDFFWGLFNDNDENYISYHQITLKIFIELLEQNPTNRISKSLLKKVMNALEEHYKENTNETIKSLLDLTQAFFNKISTETEYKTLSAIEKRSYIIDVLQNKALKQNIDYINKKLIISTIHGAKGLEWDNVILPDMEAFIFPNYNNLCKNCNGFFTNDNFCKFIPSNHSTNDILNTLNLFYVAITRSKKNVIFTASERRYTYNNQSKSSKLSCLLNIPGIKLNII